MGYHRPVSAYNPRKVQEQKRGCSLVAHRRVVKELMSQSISEILLTDSTADNLRIGGMTPMSTIDYPGESAAVIFVQGCGLRCQYCYNGHLTTAKIPGKLAWSSIYDFLSSRQGLLDAVVFGGGEAILQSALIPAVRQVKALGYKIGLHTAGSAPLRLANILSELDWVGFDIKGLSDDYSYITGVDVGDKCWQSLRMLLNSGVSYEVRTTVHWDLISADKLLKIGQWLRDEGVENFVVQDCLTDNCLNKNLEPSYLEEGQKQMVWQELDRYFPSFTVR